MEPKPEIVIAGSHAPGLFMRVKRPPIAGQTVIGWDYQEPVDGGKGSNQAIAAARLGGQVRFAGCLGQDRLGDQAIQWMEQEGIDTRYVRRSPTAATGIGFIMLDEHGVPAMVTSMGANAEFTETDVDRALEDLGPGQVLLTQFEIIPEISIYAARLACQKGVLAIVNPAPAPESLITGLDCADILVPNESEARQILGLPLDFEIEAKEMASLVCRVTGVECVIITLGDQGVAGRDQEGSWWVKPIPVEVVDTSGAGDVFCAALAVGLARGKNVRAASEWACLAATLSVTRPGTIPSFPRQDEVERFG